MPEEFVADESEPEGEANALDKHLDALVADSEAVAEVEAKGNLLVSLCHAAENRYGLRIGECNAPGAPARWGPVHRVHSPGSFHYRGRAADVSGNGQNMAAFSKLVAVNYPNHLAELIHNPGYSFKNGQKVPSSFWGEQTWAAHRNHVHLAI